VNTFLIMNASESEGKTSNSARSPENSAFERWRRKVSLITGLGVTEEDRMRDMEAFHGSTCEKWKTNLMHYSWWTRLTFFIRSLLTGRLVESSGPSVVFMLKHLRLSGCEVSPANIMCAPCDYTRSGGFSPEAGAVVLCAGRFFSKSHMENTLVHELVHMYDHCKFKVDWSDLRHHACSEVSFLTPSTMRQFP